MQHYTHCSMSMYGVTVICLPDWSCLWFKMEHMPVVYSWAWLSNCFSALWQLQSIWRSISQPVLLSLVMSLILQQWNPALCFWPAGKPAPVRSQCSYAPCQSHTAVVWPCHSSALRLTLFCCHHYMAPRTSRDWRWTDEAEVLQRLPSSSR